MPQARVKFWKKWCAMEMNSIARLLKAEAPYTGWGAYYYDALSRDRFRAFAFMAAKHSLFRAR